jgi:hypothetical protein
MVAAMPGGLGAAMYKLSNDVQWLHFKWSEYRLLFGTSPETIDLLNGVAPIFFHHLQISLWDDVLLHLCRLTDPPKMGRYRNLTIGSLPPLVTDRSLRKSLESLVNKATEKAEFARIRRNRRIAHKELPAVLRGQSEPLAPASRQHVEVALATLREIMNSVESQYQNAPVFYEGFKPVHGVESLLSYLKKGVQIQEAEDDVLAAWEEKQSS